MANRVWKLNGRRGIAYVEGKTTAERVMQAAIAREGNVMESVPQRLPEVAMAEYRDRRGKPFAWQIPFDLSRWDAICAVVEPREPSLT